jgi:hypothetical protein
LLSEEVNSIFAITKNDIKIVVNNYSQLFEKFLIAGVDDRLKKIVSIELKFNSLLQDKISSELYSFLIFKYSKGNDKKTSTMLLTNSIHFLSKVK